MIRFTVNCSILLTDIPLLERPAAARAAGFSGVEFWWPFDTAVPRDRDVSEFEQAVTDAGVQLTGLNFSAGNMAGGDRGLLSWPSRSQEFRDNVDVVAGIGERLGCKGFNALYGNRSEEFSAQQQDEAAIENLVLAGKALEKIDGTVLVEPMSGVPAYPLRTAADVFAVLEKAEAQGLRNGKLLADFYHLGVNGDDVDALVAGQAADFGHIQIADAPGRGAPGSGDLPLERWVTDSIAGGYAGWVSLEYKANAEPTGDDTFGWLDQFTGWKGGRS